MHATEAMIATSGDDLDHYDGSFTMEQKLLALAPKVSSVLSIGGSCYIIYDMIQSGRVRESTHHRLLLGMSTCDALVSLCAFFMSTWPSPANNIPPIYLAAGTAATCNAQGFFGQFSIAVAYYNACLSVFYVFKIKYQWSAKKIQRRLEPILHAIPLLIGISTACTGIALELFNPSGWECWIARSPPECQESFWATVDTTTNTTTTPCVRGDNASVYRWVMYYAILWLAILIVLVNMILVYRAVYQQEQIMMRYTFEYQQQQQQEQQISTPFNTQQGLDQSTPQDSNNGGLDGPVLETPQESNLILDEVLSGHNNNNNNHDALDHPGETASQEGSWPLSLEEASGRLKRVAGATWTTISGSFFLLRHGQNARSDGHAPPPPPLIKFKHSRRVARQGYWFCGAMLATWLFPSITRLVQVIWHVTPFPLHLLNAFFVPIQGFFNFLVYAHSRFARWPVCQRCCGCCFHQPSPSQQHHQQPPTQQQLDQLCAQSGVRLFAGSTESFDLPPQQQPQREHETTGVDGTTTAHELAVVADCVDPDDLEDDGVVSDRSSNKSSNDPPGGAAAEMVEIHCSQTETITSSNNNTNFRIS